MLLCSGRLAVCVWYSCSPFSSTKEERGEIRRDRKTETGEKMRVTNRTSEEEGEWREEEKQGKTGRERDGEKESEKF